MLNIAIVALIALFVGVIATAYYYEYKLTKKARQQKAGLPTALDRAYEKGVDAGYLQGCEAQRLLYSIEIPKL